MAIPTATFDETKTIIPQKSFIEFTPTGGSAVDLVGKLADYNQTLTTLMRKVPAADGLLRPDRNVPIEHEQSIVWEAEDMDKVSTIFGGLQGGLVKGTAELWVVDPDDASTKCAVKSNVFNCTVELDGGINFETAKLSTCKIKFVALEKIVLTPDATA